MTRARVDHGKVVDELHAALTDRFASMTTSAEWTNYLSQARKFHRYSPHNQLLLALQGAQGHVAGYRNWQRIPAHDGGVCQVAKGQTGLHILAPMKTSSTVLDDVSGEETTRHFLRGFRTVKVFHQGQLVSPPDIGLDAVMPSLLTGPNRWQQVWSAVTDHLSADGYSVNLHTRTPAEKWNGQTNWSSRDVLVADDLEPPQQLKTLLHEWAHVQLGHDTRSDLPRKIREVEAESVAFLLAQTIGLDSDAYSIPYIAGWSGGDPKIIESTAQQVLATTKQLVSTLEHELGVKLAVDVLDHALPEADTNIIALPGATTTLAAAAAIPESFAPSVPSTADQGLLFDPPGRPVAAIDEPHSTDTEFLRALGEELEPDQAHRFVEVIYRPDSAPQAASILADSGRTATQTARVLSRFGIDINTIERALLTPIDNDDELATLYPPDQAHAAIVAITPPELRPTTQGVEVSPDLLRDERIEDLKLVQRIIRTTSDPARVAAIAQGLDLSATQVVHVCAAMHQDPKLTMAIAVAIHNGNGPAALSDLNAGWAEIPGGWESYAHPSMLGPSSRAPQPVDNDPIRAMFAVWNGDGADIAIPSPQPSAP